MNEISFVSQIRCEHSLRAGSHAAPSHRPVVTQYEYVDTGQWRWTERDARHHPAASSRAQKVREGNASSRAQNLLRVGLMEATPQSVRACHIRELEREQDRRRVQWCVCAVGFAHVSP